MDVLAMFLMVLPVITLPLSAILLVSMVSIGIYSTVDSLRARRKTKLEEVRLGQLAEFAEDPSLKEKVSSSVR